MPFPIKITTTVTPVEKVGTVLAEKVIKTSGGPSGDWVIGEIPSGDVDGVNNTFTTASAYLASSLRVYLNGLKLTPSEYTIVNSTTFQMNYPTYVLDVISVDYILSV